MKSVINQVLLVFASNVDKIGAGSNVHLPPLLPPLYLQLPLGLSLELNASRFDAYCVMSVRQNALLQTGPSRPTRLTPPQNDKKLKQKLSVLQGTRL